MLAQPDRDEVNKLIAEAISPVEAKASGALGFSVGSSGKYLVPVGIDANGRGINLSVQDVGVPINGTLVIIPGTGFDAEAYQYQTSFFVQAGYRVVTIDQRGQGDSSKPASSPFNPLVAPPSGSVYSLDVFADDTFAALNQIQPPVENATMLGHSLGTAIAVHYAVKYKNAHINKLALTGMVPFQFATGLPPLMYDGAIGLATLDYGLFTFEEIIAAFNGGTAPTPPPEAVSPTTFQQYVDIFLKMPQYAFLQIAAVEQFTFNAILTPEIPQISVPTIFLQGANDVDTPPANAIAANALVPAPFREGITSFATSGHMVIYSEATAFNTALAAFI
jgi:non-heme chloroperoxidase